MKSIKMALFYGFLLWLIPFVVSILIFPLRAAGNPLFETIMPVVLTVCVVIFADLYFRNLETGFLREGIILGLVWFAVSLVIDLFMFMWGPMQMSFAAYMMDIGLTYLIFPIVTIGLGYWAEHRQNVSERTA